jgi:hypothetical protein
VKGICKISETPLKDHLQIMVIEEEKRCKPKVLVIFSTK